MSLKKAKPKKVYYYEFVCPDCEGDCEADHGSLMVHEADYNPDSTLVCTQCLTELLMPKNLFKRRSR